MPEEIGFAIVGLRRGYQAAKEVVATTGAKLVADLDVPRAQEVAQELGCEWTKDYQELLRRDDIQVVGAWTPSGAHATRRVARSWSTRRSTSAPTPENQSKSKSEE